MTIEFRHLGTFLHTRFDAAAVREKMVAAWKLGNALTLDFNKVEMMSPSFADECFGRLIKELDITASDLYKKFDFKNTSPIIRNQIEQATQECRAMMQGEYS